MSSIAPNGQIRFLTNIPIDSNYENSLDFLTELEQRTYFLSQTPVHTQVGATRVRDGVISVNKLSDELLSANYLMFQNLNFSTKWFYAFITDIEYINNNMSYVYYQIDDIQTWMFDVQLTVCFVEREHTSSDKLFEHLIDEGINVSSYIYNQSSDTLKVYKNYDALLFTSVITDSSSSTVQLGSPYLTGFQGNLNGVGVLRYENVVQDNEWLSVDSSKNYNNPTSQEYENMNQLERLNAIIRMLTSAQQKDSIVGLILVPHNFIYTSNYTKPNKYENITFNNYSGTESLNGYLPKNKKMYSSPFCTFEMGITDGQKSFLQPEYFNKGSNEIDALINISMSASFTIVPRNYAGEDKCYNKSISFSGFPQCAMSIDGYEAWVASGGLVYKKLELTKTGATFANSAIGSIVTSEQGNTNAGGMQGFNALADTEINVAKNLYDMDLAKRLPNDVIGNTSTQELFSNAELGFYIYKKCLNKDMAESIDTYFTMFGYKVNKMKQPSRRNRPHFTYLKTKGLHVNGGAPADAIRRIETIYDNGIRFWVNPAEVGNYEVNNAPV